MDSKSPRMILVSTVGAKHGTQRRRGVMCGCTPPAIGEAEAQPRDERTVISLIPYPHTLSLAHRAQNNWCQEGLSRLPLHMLIPGAEIFITPNYTWGPKSELSFGREETDRTENRAWAFVPWEQRQTIGLSLDCFTPITLLGISPRHRSKTNRTHKYWKAAERKRENV